MLIFLNVNLKSNILSLKIPSVHFVHVGRFFPLTIIYRIYEHQNENSYKGDIS